MFLNHASCDLNMLKLETSRFPCVMISEYVPTRILIYIKQWFDDIWESLHIRMETPLYRLYNIILQYCTSDTCTVRIL